MELFEFIESFCYSWLSKESRQKLRMLQSKQKSDVKAEVGSVKQKSIWPFGPLIFVGSPLRAN